MFFFTHQTSHEINGRGERPDLIDPKNLQIPESEAMGLVFFCLLKNKKKKRYYQKRWIPQPTGRIAYSVYDHTFWTAEYA